MPAERLASYLEQTAGENLRGVVEYDQHSTDIVYVRDDLRSKHLHQTIDRILTRLTPETHGREEQSFPFGELRATVRDFEKAIVMHFPQENNQGIVVTLEPETARSLDTFVGNCRARIEE